MKVDATLALECILNYMDRSSCSYSWKLQSMRNWYNLIGIFCQQLIANHTNRVEINHYLPKKKNLISIFTDKFLFNIFSNFYFLEIILRIFLFFIQMHAFILLLVILGSLIFFLFTLIYSYELTLYRNSWNNWNLSKDSQIFLFSKKNNNKLNSLKLACFWYFSQSNWLHLNFAYAYVNNRRQTVIISHSNAISLEGLVQI